MRHFLYCWPRVGPSLSRSFRSHGGMGRDEVLLGLLMLVAVMAGLWAVSRLMGLRRRRRGFNNPWQLFQELCKVHHLSWSDGWLLRHRADIGTCTIRRGCSWKRIAAGRSEAWPTCLEVRAVAGTAESTLQHDRPDTKTLLRKTRRVQQIRPPRVVRSRHPPHRLFFSASPRPTLDLPPWNESSSVEV